MKAGSRFLKALGWNIHEWRVRLRLSQQGRSTAKIAINRLGQGANVAFPLLNHSCRLALGCAGEPFHLRACPLFLFDLVPYWHTLCYACRCCLTFSLVGTPSPRVVPAFFLITPSASAGAALALGARPDVRRHQACLIRNRLSANTHFTPVAILTPLEWQYREALE